MFNVMEKAMESNDNLGTDYIELRAESGFIEYLQMDDFRITALTQRIESGVAIRVLANGAWGFVSTSHLNKLDQAIKDAFSMAKAASKARKEPIVLADIKIVEATIDLDIQRDPRYVPVDEKIQYMKDMTKASKEYDDRITAVSVQVRTASNQKYLLTSDGTRIKTQDALVWTLPWVTAKEGTRVSAARFEDASTKQGWEYMEDVATPEFIGESAAKKAKLQIEGVLAKAGSFPCVVGPRVIGVLAHEALGHLAESDLLVRSAFNGKIGEVVAAEGVNMTDDGTISGNVGTGRYDDEGIATSRVEIIKDSVLTELLTNREDAVKTGQKLSGNARAQSYLFPPLVRMRNTYFEKGDHSTDELFEGIEFGYYCADFRGGQAQMNASFQVGVQEAHEIVNGEIGRPVTDLSISGIATDSLFKIAGISKDAFGWEYGRCGKFGQEVFTASGGPNIRFSKGGITFGGKN